MRQMARSKTATGVRTFGAMLIVALTLLSATGSPAAAQTSAAQQLAEQYAPIAMLREQSDACDSKGEGYFPAPVDFLFDNPDIQLKANAEGDPKDDPILIDGNITPQDLADAPANTYLDFPGNPRKPGCEYEEYFKAKVEELGLEPTTYVKIAVDPAKRRLYLEYWFYYYFNDWNNTHESDWEMMQLVFEGVTTPEEALEVEPSFTAYAQHAGGETATWGDDKIEMQGTRPVVYPSAGSHATYYSPHTYIGWGENGTAFGCDNTTEPHVETPLNVIVVPETIDPESDLAFFLYPGKWGERQSIELYSGPGGANLGKKWNDPTAAIANWRDSTLKVPGGGGSGVNTTDAFCTLSEWGSKAVTAVAAEPWAVLAIVGGLIALIGFLVYRIWPYFLEAIDIYGNELRTFLGIGAMVIPIGIVFSILTDFLITRRPLNAITGIAPDSPGASLAASAVLGGLQQVVQLLIVVPAVVYAVKDIRRGVRPGVWRSYRNGLRYLPVTIPALLVVAGLLIVGGAGIILLLVALYVIVRWQFFTQAAILDEERPFTAALGRSWTLTRGKWLRTLAVSAVYQFLALVPGPLFGIIVLILGGSRVQFANFMSAFIFALTIPVAYIGLSMYYHRLAGRPIVEPDMVTRPAGEALRPDAPIVDTPPAQA